MTRSGSRSPDDCAKKAEPQTGLISLLPPRHALSKETVEVPNSNSDLRDVADPELGRIGATSLARFTVLVLLTVWREKFENCPARDSSACANELSSCSSMTGNK